MTSRREDLPGVIAHDRWMAFLRKQLRPDERVVAPGRTAGGQFLLVTTDRVLLEGGPREYEAIDFDQVTDIHEVLWAHSTTLVLVHPPLPRRRKRPYPWDLPEWIRRSRTGDRWRTETMLRFNQATAKAAIEIRRALKVRLGEKSEVSTWRRPPKPWGEG